MLVPKLWTNNLVRNQLGPASAARHFILNASKVGKEFVPEDHSVSIRDACFLYVLARKRRHSAFITDVARCSGIHAGASFEVGRGLQEKGLISVDMDDETHFMLTDTGRALCVEAASIAS